MQTTETTPVTTLTTRTATSTAHRLLVVLLLTLTVMTGTAATSAPPAEAATGANVSFCYRHPSGAPASHMTVYLRIWNGSSWANYRTGRSNSRGCGVFYNVARYRYYETLLHEVIGDPAYCSYYPVTVAQAFSPRYRYVSGTSTGNHYVGRATVWTRRIC